MAHRGGDDGGVIVGAVAKMIGLDVFALMFATSPGDITGAPEGAVIGAAVGLGSWLTTRFSLRRSLVLTALGGAASGVVIALMGGRMMAGSLVLFSQHFTGSRLRLEGLGRVFGEDGFGPVTAASTGAIEGLLFAVGVVMAMAWAETQARKAPPTVASDGPVRAKNDSLDRF